MKHAIRNALITPFTAILLQLNFLFTSVVVVETVFGFPGFGRMLVEAALYKDVFTVETATLFAVFVVVITQVIGDLSYMLLNPRIRFS
jgi:peptide/nickel transport system permease protein